MGYHSNIMAFIQEHEGEPIAKAIEALLNKELDKSMSIETISTFVDYCDYYM